ncbi:hypothetical protein BAE44_0007179 [Dichanthelium oligosanthes]|uniref:3'-5' exonuclease domain-containing protein n=1 Tax=Dichanthelium oligosanthes TaxID=888268 RepID=A0A1E5W314_9POAL|nr:hypothetical protein BAE44_0007179 [Dichanthelium oligosanthes]
MRRPSSASAPSPPWKPPSPTTTASPGRGSGRPPRPGTLRGMFRRDRRSQPYTVRAIALCVGGSHALVYQPCAPWEPSTGATGKIEFYRNKMQELHAFLGDARVTVACLGADEAAKKLARSWGRHVARPTDLKRLVERAYGKDVEVDVEVDGRMERRRVNMRKGLGLEGMALLMLGQEMQLEKTPARAAQADWGRMVERDELMYATRDAYLCFEIAVRCLHKLGASVT